MKVELSGVGENIQEHLYHGAVFGTRTIIVVRGLGSRAAELKKDTVDGREIQTLDLLMNPVTAKEHMELL